MVRIKDFIAYMRSKYLNHCAYLWGGSGQIVGKTTPDEIVKAESTSDKPKINARRVLAFVGKMAECGYNLNIAQFFDCSGYVIDGLEHFSLYNGPDIRADDLYNLGEGVTIKNAWPGDLVFLGSDTKKTHVGVYVGDGVCYECKGRDDGVVMSNLSDWKYAAHYTWFDTLALGRRLKLTSPHMTGEDVRLLQFALCSHGFKVDCDGDFGSKTEKTVKEFQIVANLDVASFGVVGRKTAEALGFTYNI